MKDNADLRARIGAITDEIAPDLIALRRHLHENPELGFEEVETAARIKSHLDAEGIEWQDGFGKTGIAARIGQGPGRVVAIRGDMDALPIHETGNPAYRSRRDGVMHACGHDAHTAIAVGAATVLARLADHLPGRAMMVFQPAEEGLGGARAMIEDGLFDWQRPDIFLGYHNWPLIPGGTIGYHPHAAFASTDPFDIVVRGRSGHGAHPHLTRDPIVAAGALVSALQTIVAREIAPLEAGVISVGSIKGGSARNQIPDEVRLEGTTRSQKPEIREAIRGAIQRIARGVAETHGVEIEVEFLAGVPPVINDAAILAPVLEEARAMVGAERVIELPQGSMGSEDYAEFSTRFPSAHLRIGSGIEGRQTMLHRSDFDLDEAAIPAGVRAVVAGAIRMMETG